MRFSPFEGGSGGAVRPQPDGAKRELNIPRVRRALLLGAMLAPALCAGGTIDEIRETLRSRALDPVPEAWLGSLREENLSRLLPQLDPYAELLASSAPRSQGAVEADRLGAELYQRDGESWLLPYVEGPLAAAGVTQRAVLDSVDGQPVAGRSAEDIARLIAASAAGKVRLSLWRVGTPGWETVDVTLAPFRPVSVEGFDVAGQRVIRIRSFVARETRLFLAEAVKGTRSGMVVIDLRDCLGGDLFEALDAAALFIPQGEQLAASRDRQGSRQYSSPGGEKFNQPLGLLVGPDTASAGEIFAGILKERNRAKLVGMRTRGKCRSQTDVPLSDGSRFRFTNMAVLLPGGRECEGAGVEPHFPVEGAELFDTPALLRRLSKQ